MSVRLRDVLGRRLTELRYEPTPKRVRARLGGVTVVDSVRALLVWEPRRVVPTYAVPAEDIDAELRVSASTVPGEAGAAVGVRLPEVTDLPVLDPRQPFSVRSTDGVPVDIRATGGRTVAGFRPSDGNLSGYVILDFAGFDEWLEEDDEIVSHPRDPFHRVDVRNSSRHVRLTLEDRLLAETTRPRIAFETMLPMRYYIPVEDVAVDLVRSPTRTACSYKGAASYWSAEVGDRLIEDLVWGYEDPLPDAAMLAGYVCFFDEKVDVVLDGEPRERPVTPWS